MGRVGGRLKHAVDTLGLNLCKRSSDIGPDTTVQGDIEQLHTHITLLKLSDISNTLF